ncbi:MAG: N-acetylmuramoyl-L-alanine amidase [Bacteroidota bacterium]
MKNCLFSLLFFSSVFFCFSQDTAVENKIKYYTQKADRYLDKQKALSSFYAINNKGISIYASSKDKLADSAEFRIKWDQVESFNQFLKAYSPNTIQKFYLSKKFDPTSITSNKAIAKIDPAKKLSGLKIAIDAGHVAGDFKTGQTESKCLEFTCDNLKGNKDSIEIAEGMLTYATAKLLKEKLEAQGAEVFLTRPFNGCTAFGVSFEDWLKTSYKSTLDSLYKIKEITLDKKNWLLSKASKRDKFRLVFKDMELQKRAEMINNYKPDFTIIIHYNVDETNTGWTKPSNKNFNMAFVGGAFMRSDLSSPRKRFEFLRLLVSDDLERSIALSSSVVKSFEKNLNVKTAGPKDATYLTEGCLPTPEKGVYCRNLQLTRYIHSPLVYGETLYQDNVSECILLNQETDKTKNLRVQQVAEAYFQGVLNYAFTK